MISPLELGPLNGGVLAAMLGLGTVAAVRAITRAHRAEAVAGLPLVALMVLPLAFVAWASAVQLPEAMHAAMTHPHAPAKQTLMAMAISRGVATQLYGGAGVALLAGVLAGGVFAVTVPGDRPQLSLGTTGILLGGVSVLVAAISLAVDPRVVLAVRVALYGAAAFGTVTALIAAHRRGPGVQLGTLAGIAFPLFVAGVDQASMAWVAGSGFSAIAVAAPAAKQAMMDTLMSDLELLRRFSGLQLGLATALATLGPLAAWKRERPLALNHLAALAAGVIVAGVGVGYASNWFVGF